jgi:glycosyltransferase involved in cell wall biosynthesis
VNIALALYSLSAVGGGERLALDMYRALRELGHEVDLYTTRFDERAWQVLTSDIDNIPRPIVVGVPPMVKFLGRTGTLRKLLVTSYLVRRLRPHYDLVIETQIGVPLRWTDAAYVHFPLVEILRSVGNQRRLRLHEKAYDLFVIWLMTSALVDTSRPMMANSTWTAKYVRRAYGSPRVYVVHPPVNVEELSSIGNDRSRVVLTVSRIDRGKKVIEIPNIARLVPEAEFYLVGATRSESGPILKVLKERAEGLSNFHLETDVSRRRIIELMSQASIYLHPPLAEPFGIAIAEAAAAGLVPVVYRDGGGWTDIASRIDQGLGYTNVEEAARTVRSLLNDAERLKTLSAKARDVAKGFKYERFKERLSEVIKELART